MVKQVFTFFSQEHNMNRFVEILRTKNLERVQMRPETWEYLKDLYREDILKVQALIKRDLSKWLR